MLISTASRKLNSDLHSTHANYGNRETGGGSADRLVVTLDSLYEKNACKSYLDYGTGKGKLPLSLKKHLKSPYKISAYDPANAQFDKHPSEPHDFLTCLDVLEHVEHNAIHSVLSDIRNLTKKIAFLIIDLQPAIKKLSTGQNAHILLAPHQWWSEQVSTHFPVFLTYPIYHRSGTLQKCGFICGTGPDKVDLVCYVTQKLKSHNTKVKGGYLG